MSVSGPLDAAAAARPVLRCLPGSAPAKAAIRQKCLDPAFFFEFAPFRFESFLPHNFAPKFTIFDVLLTTFSLQLTE